MGNTARGKHALFISDRSGLQFPYTEMVREWNGSRVHTSEYEPKQPQLEPKPFTADPQGLMHPRPDRLELPTGDFLKINPFSTPNLPTVGATFEVSQPNSGILVGDFVRLMSIAQPLSAAGSAFVISIKELEMTTTLSANITATDTSMVVDDATSFYTNGGYLMIEKINSVSGLYENEIIQYAAYNSGTKTLSGLIRGTNSPFRGQTPKNTIASNHDAGANIFGAREVYALSTTTSSSGGQPPTVTNQNGYYLKDNDEGFSWVANFTGGGNGCIAGPLNVNITDGRA
jgi:hypothetical protein